MQEVRQVLDYHRERFTRRFISQLAAEFLGTMFLTEIVACTIANPNAVYTGNAPIGIGFALAIIVYAFGHISGGHVNPSVSLALYMRGAVDFFTMGWYIFIQIFGGMIGAAIGTSIAANNIGIRKTEGYSVGQAIVAEIFFTSLLCTVVINVATTKANKGTWFYGFAIGTTVTAAGYAVGDISGGAFNPAVATGIIILTPSESNKNLWIYWIGDLLGSLMSGIVWYVINWEEKEEENIRRYTTQQQQHMLSDQPKQDDDVR
jgi:aquaporin Z